MSIGSISGDIIGSRFEGSNKHPNRINFELFPIDTYFTDDSVMTIATMAALLNAKDGTVPYAEYYRKYYRKYPYAGYGKSFSVWASSNILEAYNSYGNGSAMRVSPISFVYNTKEEVMEQAKLSAEVTHSHVEGIRGAQAIAYATFLARIGSSKKQIRDAMENEIGYDLLNLKKGFHSDCLGSVPNAIVAFLNSESFVDAIRGAILMGGDSDTIACMAGSIAQPYYNNGLKAIPTNIIKKVFQRLPDDLADVVVTFTNKYIDSSFTKPTNMSKKAKIYDLYRSIFKG